MPGLSWAELVVTTEALLLGAAVVAAAFMAVVLVEGAVRPGYRPSYHTGSELELGERGWVQRANFLLMGAGVFALAVGVDRTLDTTAGAVLLAVFGLGLVVAGVFVPDAVRGYPPGAPTAASHLPTWQHRIHHVGGPVAFFALFAACLTLARQLQGAWRWYTVLTAIAGLALTLWTAVSYQRDAANTGLVQRGLLLVYWTWIVILGIHLAANPPQP